MFCFTHFFFSLDISIEEKKEMFSVDQVGRVWEKCEDKIFEERLRYESVYEKIEDYIVSANRLTVSKDRNDPRIIIGGAMGLNLLLKRDSTHQEFVYELYTEDSLHHANSLSNEIASLVKDSWIVRMVSKIPNIQYEIWVDFRLMVKVFTLKSDPVKAYELIQPVQVKSHDEKRDLLVLSPEMHLIEIYKTLSLPNEVGLWEEKLDEELQLFQLLKQRVKTIGGDEMTKDERTNVENALLAKFVVGNKNIVLLGEHAFKIIYGKHNKQLQTSSPVILVISTADPEEDYNTIKKIITETLGRNIPVTKLTRSVNVMQDHRILRTTIKVGSETNQKEVMYIYNSAQYDLIPFNTAVSEKNSEIIQVANPFVLIRFLLIDLWVVRWVKEMGKINEFFADKRVSNIISLIIELRNMMGDGKIKDEFYAKNDELLNVFQRNRYIGKYVDETIAMKLSMTDQKRYADYYPQGYLRKNGEYRKL